MTLLPILSALLLAASSQQPFHGLAVAGDGDSLTVNGERVRLFGIDAPEFDQTCTRDGKSWACGSASAEQLRKLVTGRTVRCLRVGTDQHDRTLARCSVGETDINRHMVATGYAVAFRRYSSDYVVAENSAKAAKRGMWAGSFAMPSDVRAAAAGQIGRVAMRRHTAHNLQSVQIAG